MDLRLKTWNGNNINDGTNFVAVFPPGQKANLSANPVTVNRAGEFPYLSTTVLSSQMLVIEVYIAAGASINTYRETLKGYFNIMDRTRHNLVAEDGAGGTQYYVTGFPVGIAPVGSAPKNGFAIRLQLEYPYWQLVTATSDTWSITASGDTKAITNAGNIPVPPVFTITPTSNKSSGLSYRRFVSIYSNLDVTFDKPLDITDGGLDTAALTTAKMQADGDDFRVWEDGSFADRWLDAMDTANTKCWKNTSYQPRHEATLLTSLANAGTDVDLVFVQTRNSKLFLQYLQHVRNPALLIESEVFTFSKANIDTVLYKITGAKRARKDTSYAAHTAPKTVRHLEHDLWILYGDSTLTAPDTDDTKQPMISLASTNASWTWTNFYSSASSRPTAWSGEVNGSKTQLSRLFTDNEYTDADPSTELGLALIGSTNASNPLQEVGQLDWALSHPAGFTDVAYSGEKYRANSFPAVAGLQYLVPNTSWVTAQNETQPSVALTWEAFSQTITLPATYANIRFALDGSLNPATGEMAAIQFDTVTATIASGNLPTIALGAETAVNFLDITLTNTTTGEYLRIQTPCLTNDTLTIDCANKTAYLSDGSRVRVELSTTRDNWLDLASGANTLKYEDAGTVGTTLVTLHRDRNL